MASSCLARTSFEVLWTQVLPQAQTIDPLLSIGPSPRSGSVASPLALSIWCISQVSQSTTGCRAIVAGFDDRGCRRTSCKGAEVPHPNVIVRTSFVTRQFTTARRGRRPSMDRFGHALSLLCTRPSFLAVSLIPRRPAWCGFTCECHPKAKVKFPAPACSEFAGCEPQPHRTFHALASLETPCS